MANRREHFFSFQKPIFSRQPLPTAHAHTVISARGYWFFSNFSFFFVVGFFCSQFRLSTKSYVYVYTKVGAFFPQTHKDTLKTERQNCASSIFFLWLLCTHIHTLELEKIHIFSPALAFNTIHTCIYVCVFVSVYRNFFAPSFVLDCWTTERTEKKLYPYNKASPSSVVLILDCMRTDERTRNKER